MSISTLWALFARLRLSSPTTTVEKNIRFLYYEVFFAGIMSAIISFNSAFAIRLGASNDMIGLLTSLPALVTAIASIPSARFMQTRHKRKLWLVSTLMAYRGGYLVVAIIPWLLASDPVTASTLIVWWIILLNLPLIFFGNDWSAMLGELVPDSRRAYVFSRRSIIVSITVAIGSAVVGRLLYETRDAFPQNYQLTYIFGVIAVMGSQFYISRLHVPDREKRPVAPVPKKAAPPRERIKLTPSMTRLLLDMGVYQVGLTISSALFNVYYINTLGASDDWIGLNGFAGSAGVVVGYFLWERVLRNHSFAWAIRRASLLTWIFPAVLAFFPNLNLILLGNFAVNLVHPGVDLSSANILLKLPRQQDRTSYISLYAAVVSVSAFISPLVGVWLSDHTSLGIPGVMAVSGLIRILGGVLFNINPVDDRIDNDLATPRSGA